MGVIYTSNKGHEKILTQYIVCTVVVMAKPKAAVASGILSQLARIMAGIFPLQDRDGRCDRPLWDGWQWQKRAGSIRRVSCRIAFVQSGEIHD